MKASSSENLPHQPLDHEVEEEARKAIETGNWLTLEQYIFRDLFLPTWVLHIAITEICRNETAEHVGKIESLLVRAFEEMEDCPELLVHTIGQAEDFAKKHRDNESATRLLLLRYKVYAKARRNGTWDEPLI